MLAMFLPTMLGLLTRHALTAAGGAMAVNGWADPASLDGLVGCVEALAPNNDTAAQILGGVMALAGLAWSGTEKWRRLR